MKLSSCFLNIYSLQDTFGLNIYLFDWSLKEYICFLWNAIAAL